MSHRRLIPISLALLALGLSDAKAALAGTFQITKHTTVGGLRSTGGDFSLTGSIGQHDAGTHTGGAFTLRAGFWAPVLGDAIFSNGFETP